MANKLEQIEKIAREEVYPERYFGRAFPGEWPSDRHHAICLNVAEDIYKLRTAEEKRISRTKNKEKVEEVETGEVEAVEEVE